MRGAYKSCGGVGRTLGEVTKSSPASAAASKSPKLETGFTIAAESAVGLGAVGIEAAGMDSSMGLVGTGGAGCATGAAAAILPISLFTRRLKSPVCPPPKFHSTKVSPRGIPFISCSG